MDLILGVDLACRAAHVASLARRDGTFVWTGRKCCTRSTDLDRLWVDLDLGAEDSLVVVMEPTRNAWASVAAWFRRRGAEVVLVPTTQSADLRAYYANAPRMTGSTPGCWPGCRCSIPTGYAATPATDPPSRCGGR